jgi:glycosyltransferase involved in cell wall biosynthesis
LRAQATGEKGLIRQSLGLPEDKMLFLCIGFVQPHKGFDRLLRTLRRVESDKVMARIVGSVRINWQPALDYARKLHQMAADDPRAGFIETFVSDEDFDRWIIAADYVVVPYHEIWSSGVAARAKLHGRPVIASLAGGLAEQLPEGSITFGTDKELESAIRRIVVQAERRPASTGHLQDL